ncbi:ABC transporter substrate-binding protein [Elongatibacter sediminis]|uniref:ABC transporter substrate-binding protein n=1 Tax=Elongatibacter sediminis TaxID=3119006 RepID=A0AAW9R6Y0_9GAMM
MSDVTLGFKAFDPHELLVHFMAVEAGLYRRENLNITLTDITFVADTELPPDVFQASCGAALTSAIRGLPQRVLFVAVDRPMFWIWTQEPVSALAGFRGRRLATFPVQAPPYNLARVILGQAGVNADSDVQLLPARDDVARIGLLRSGSADGAVLSSAVPPARLTALGLHQTCFFGDHLRLPTTGLGVDRSMLERDPGLVSALTNVHRESLHLIHAEPDRTAAILSGWFGVETEHASITAELYASAFTRDGRTTAEIAEQAIAAIGGALNVTAPPDWRTVYPFD